MCNITARTYEYMHNVESKFLHCIFSGIRMLIYAKIYMSRSPKGKFKYAKRISEPQFFFVKLSKFNYLTNQTVS